ncbi:MAG: DUF4340 domain-containing protein [Verrucomicrobia bacterium]|nr:DUF4340 domain-containing protein [Verrucomicrobiota bacterium]
MKGKQLATLLAILAVLGTAGWLVLRNSNSAWSETSASTPGAKVISLPINDVAKVTLRTSAGELNLNRKDDGWTVAERADFPANFETVSTLLRKINDLKTVQEVKAGPSQLPRLELVEPAAGASNAGTLLEMKDTGGKTLGALLLGKKYLKKSEGAPADAPGYPAGRYVMPVGKGNQISLVSDSFEDAEIKPERWLSKEFFRVESPRSIELSGPTPARKWKVTRETPSSEWVMAGLQGDEKSDQSKINSFAGSFGNATFSDVLAPDAKAEVTGLDQPTVLTVETFDGFRYELKIGKPSGDGYAATVAITGTLAKERTPGKDEKPEDKEKLDKEFAEKSKRLSEKLTKEQKLPARIYVMPKYAVDPFLKDRSGLLADKPAATPTPAPVPGVPPVAPTVPGAPAGGTSVTTPPVAVPPVNPSPAPKASPTPAKKGAK